MKAAIPHLLASMPRDVDLLTTMDRSVTIRSSLQDTELTLLIAVGLVTGVVFLFLRSARATLIPAIAVPVSIAGTFAAMYLLGYSLDNLSLMALTVATGFVVDDAIVVLENISRHIEDGVPRVQAALIGAREVGFTVVSISISLIAVFLPILLMGGIIGRMFREFAVTLSMSIVVSLAISLTVTPMMCALMLKPADRQTPAKRTLLDRAITLYGRTLAWSLRHSLLVILVLLITIGLNVALYIVVPKGFFPLQDTGRMAGSLQADQSISFQAMEQKLKQLSDLVQRDPAVDTVVGFTGANGGARATNQGSVYVSLKPRAMRDGIETVMARLRDALSVVPGAKLFLVPVQDIGTQGGRQTNAAYQYTLQADSSADLYEWAPKLVTALEHDPVLRDVNSDQQQSGLETDVLIDRETASRLGVNAEEIDNTLYDAFGQRQVSTIYKAQSQYHVVMEVAPRYWQSPQTLNDIYVSTSGGPASGVEISNAVVGTGNDIQHRRYDDRRDNRWQFRAQRGDKRAGERRQGYFVISRRGQHEQGNDDPAGSLRPLSRRPHGAGGEPPGILRGEHNLFQPGSWQVAERRDCVDRERDAADPDAGLDSRVFSGGGANVPTIAEHHADTAVRRLRRRLHRAGRAL